MILDLLFPRKCILCRRILDKSQTDLCEHCRREAPWFTARKRKIPFTDGFCAVFVYQDAVRESILRYKFGGQACYAASYGKLLALCIQEQFGGEFDVLTYVPISFRRRVRRGYDQMALLAKEVGRELHKKPVRLLRKVRHNKPQSSLQGDALRRANVLGAYRLRDPAAVAGKRILILDDILTTGATVSECAKTLSLAGAQQVFCACLACART